MTNNKKRCVCLVTLVIAFVILLQTNVLTIMIFELKGNTKLEERQVTKEVVQETQNMVNEWKLNIPKISLSYSIEEGTTQDVIDNGIGHFSDTAYLDGNVGLVAGCYGYNKNIFENLDKLQEKDVILYSYEGKQKAYEVVKNLIIDENDWSYLNETHENKLTLITGVVNEPEKRRCVQAKQID